MPDNEAEKGAADKLLASNETPINLPSEVVHAAKSVDDSNAQLIVDVEAALSKHIKGHGHHHHNHHQHKHNIFRSRSNTLESKKDGNRASKSAIRVILLFTTVLFGLSVALIAVTLNLSSFIDLAVHEQLSTLLQQQQQPHGQGNSTASDFKTISS